VVAEVQRHRQLADDAGPGVPHLRDQLGGQGEVRLDADDRHATQVASHLRILGNAVEVGAEVAHLHDLYAGAAHMVENVLSGGQTPVLDVAVEPEVSRHWSISGGYSG